MTDQKRTYTMTRRAEQQEQTRRRITESAVELHGTLGPALTSMSAVAAHAGVRRSTLYRHFGDEAALFHACSAHWAAANPLPDLARWAEISDPSHRLTIALKEIYPFYRRNENMLDNLFRDQSTVAAVGEHFAAFHGYLVAAVDILMTGRRLRGAERRRTAAALGHAVAYSTWRSLAGQHGLTDVETSVLVCALVAAAAPAPAR